MIPGRKKMIVSTDLCILKYSGCCKDATYCSYEDCLYDRSEAATSQPVLMAMQGKIRGNENRPQNYFLI